MYHKSIKNEYDLWGVVVRSFQYWSPSRCSAIVPWSTKALCMYWFIYCFQQKTIGRYIATKTELIPSTSIWCLAFPLPSQGRTTTMQEVNKAKKEQGRKKKKTGAIVDSRWRTNEFTTKEEEQTAWYWLGHIYMPYFMLWYLK